MNVSKPYLFAVAAALLAAPVAFAHTDGGPYGTPKTYCEDAWWTPDDERHYHDYGPNAGLLLLPLDGSLGPECPYSAGSDNPLHDGHFEFALGGAWLVASNGNGVTNGATACGWPYPDHITFPTVWVFDHVLSQVPADVSFAVYADAVSYSGDPCGDFESDYGVECVSHCTVGFPPGLDGTYQVYVNGVMGHVWTN